jgi:hypothetical protein
MHKFYTSSFDASIYLQQPDQNAGRDGILEVGKLYYGTVKDVYRTLIKFDVSNLETGSGWKAYLNLKAANSEELPLEYTIYANAVSQSWSMGTGTKFDNISTDGVSWKYRDGVNKWVSYDTTGGTAVYTQNTTGSANAEGGVWYLSGSASQSFNYESDDVRMDVTNLITQWITGSFANNGMIIHHSLEAESDDLDYGVLKFFSKETNTIYQPKLEIVWDDSSIVTGSLAPVTGSAEDGYKVVITNLKTQYEADSKIKVRVKGRDKYPSKTFGTTFSYDQSKYLPTTTYYQLEDYTTKEIIFPFGTYTKVSCDSTSNYFVMDLSTLPINRTYLLKLKIVEGGISTIIDDKLKFEII